MNRLSLNTYSLTELLGPQRKAKSVADGSGITESLERHPQEVSPEITLLELPALLAERGIGAVDICYNHFPATDEAYLSQLREALSDARIEPFCLLIDFGNLTQPRTAEREAELDWLAQWIRRAGTLGATCARVVAGDGDPDDAEAMERAVAGYKALAEVAAEAGVRLLTENLGNFARGADTLLALVDRLDGAVGLCADFGNGRRPGDYGDLKRLVAQAESIHAKPELKPDGTLDEADFRTCVELAEEAGFTGPYTLVYRGPAGHWEGIAQTKQLVTDVLGQK